MRLRFLEAAKWRRPDLEANTLPVAVILKRFATDFLVFADILSVPFIRAARAPSHSHILEMRRRRLELTQFQPEKPDRPRGEPRNPRIHRSLPVREGPPLHACTSSSAYFRAMVIASC